VLLVAPSAKAGGAERALAGLARQLPAHGLEPLAVLLEGGPLEGWLAEAGCPVALPEAGIEDDSAAVTHVQRYIEETEVRVVVSSKWEAHLVAGVAAEAASVPAVFWQHDIAQRAPGELRAASIPAAAIVCSSDHAVRAQRALTPRARIVKVHPGAPIAEIAARRGSGRRVREALGWGAAPLVGIVGRLDHWKGQDVFLRAARHVATRSPSVRFAVVGGAIIGTEGSIPDDLRRLAAELGLADRVHFAGHQDDVYPWFDALDVVVHASVAEPFGLVIVEAMALGKPVVATRVAGPTEIVEDGTSGLLVPPGDPRPTAAAIMQLLEDPELAERLGEQARQRAHAFSEERMGREFAALIRHVLAETA
jgi:glycosyltransferase involved in cell wall biosynthesis